MSEWYDNLKKPSDDFHKLLKERIDNPVRYSNSENIIMKSVLMSHLHYINTK